MRYQIGVDAMHLRPTERWADVENCSNDPPRRVVVEREQEQIDAQVDAMVPLPRQCKGFMFAVDSHIPANVPVDNAQYYLDCLQPAWQR